MSMRTTTALVLLMLAAGVANASDADDAAALLRGTVGRWAGTLTYSDYQTGEKTVLPVVRSAALLPDGKTLQIISTYEDGPSKTVYINALALVNAKAGTWESAAFRDGDAMETSSASLSMPRPATDPTHWIVVTQEKGIDGDSPATIRETITRAGDRLTTLTEYNRVGDAADSFKFRNEESVVLTAKATPP